MMSLRTDFEDLKARPNPTKEDYSELIGFTEGVIKLLQKERQARSALCKKNRKLASVKLEK